MQSTRVYKMHRSRHGAIQAAITWFQNAQQQSNYTDPQPLVDALQVGGLYWPKGLIGARLESYDNGDASIWLAVIKPRQRRTYNERSYTEFRLEPEAVFVLLLHCIAGLGIGIKNSASHAGNLPYFYLSLYNSQRSVRFHRFIANAPSNRLALVGGEDFHDLRTESLMGRMNIGAATEIYGPQKKGPYATRTEFITLATSVLDNYSIPHFETKRAYRDMLSQAYRLLDLRKAHCR
jgi:hypothetical protein